MKTRYRFIHFTPDNPDHTEWQCRNNGQPEPSMATIGYYDRWKQWVFAQNEPEFVFSADCLTDIAHFMGQLPKP